MVFCRLNAIVLLSFALPALADPGGEVDSGTEIFIEFGVDMGELARNRECDDPRFENTTSFAGMASRPSPEALFHDAYDCLSAFEKGLIAPRMEYGDIRFSHELRVDPVRHPPFLYAGPCNDPRLEGPGVVNIPEPTAGFEDPSPLECRNAFLAGTAILKNWTDGQHFLYGFDGGKYAYDGECDDPRFEGFGAATALNRRNVGRDAYDCRYGENIESIKIEHDEFNDFGNNASRHSYDGECDDTRFEGLGMSGITSNMHVRRDAMDCYRGYIAGDIELKNME